MYDFYRSKKEPDVRMATLPGAGLPSNVDPNDWELIPSAAQEIYVVDAADIEERGFFYYKLVEERPLDGAA